MNDFFLHAVNASLYYTFDFSADIASPATLVSVTFSSADGLTLTGQSNDLSNGRASIRVSGAEHGLTYVVQATGVTSSGESIVKDITLQGFNA
jgi:hypothetical protein